MEDAKRVGRMVGVMFLLMIVGLMAGFIMLDALRMTDYLGSAAGNAMRVNAGVIVLLLNGVLAVGIAIIGRPVFGQYSSAMSVWLIVCGVVMLLMQAVDTVHIMSMVSLSQQYLDSGSADGYQFVAASVRTARRFAHYLELFAIDFFLMMFYAILLRFGLVPRLLAGFALVTVLLQFFAVPVPGFLGYAINTNLGVPMAIGMLSVALWLMVRGFAQRD